MYLEVALSEEDDYVRLQKLSLGIKEIASIIPSVQTFGDMQTLKLLLCSYPFQQNSVELLISILFDRFKDVHFLQAFHSACIELAQLQEQRAFLSQRSLSLKSSRINASLNLSMEQKKISSNQSFSKAVIGKLLIAKKFCVSYLKPLFQLANDLGQDLEKFARIFKVFILNTKDQQFIYKIIAIFEECKNDIFGNRQWVSSYYEEIDQFFLQNHISIPSEKRESTILDRNSRVSFQPDNNNPNDADSDGSSEENVDDQFQQWLCCSETLEMSEKESLFRNPENFDEFLKYILHPDNVELHGCWFEKYKNLNVQKDSPSYYKVYDKQMKPEETIRSYKALQVLIKEENTTTLSQLVPQNLLLIFNAIYDCLLDQFHNANLNHIASLIESLLTRKAKLAAIQFVELNLFFSLSVYLYNPLISNILESKIIIYLDIVNLTIDKYQLGCFFQEQVWKYLCKTEWFKFLTQLISGEQFNQKLIDKSTKSEATISTLSVLKTLSQYDKQQMIVNLIDLDQKQQLTNFLGMLQPGKSSEAYYTSNQLNWHLNSDVIEYISMTQIKEKDIDNLSNFVDDRNTNVLIKKYFHEMKLMKSKKLIEPEVSEQVKDHQEEKHYSLSNNTLQVRNAKSKGSKTVISRRKSQVKVIQKMAQSSASLQNSPTVHSPGLQTLTQVEGEDSVDELNPTFRKQQKKFSFLYHSSTFRNRTEGNNNTNEGFSSSRLKTIYPSYKTSIQNTEYEKQFEHMALDQKYFNEGINLLMLATKSQIDFLKSNNENVKQTLNRLDLSSICQNFLSETQLNKYFQVYMYDVLENKPSDNIGDDCGIFINFIMENIIELGQLEESRQAMCNSFIQVLEYFCKIIYMTHKNPNFLISTKHKFKKTLLMSTLTNGFYLLFINDVTIMQKMIIKHLNESVLHILIIWFFDSDQNNQYQRNFLVFMNLFLNAAPQSLISSLFFKIGLIASLQNAYSKLFVNGIKNDSNHESLYFYIQMLIETILSIIRKRSLIQLETNLNSMESWHILTNNKSYREPKLIAKINDAIAKNLKESEATSPAFLISSKQSYLSIHKEDSTNKRKQSHDVTYQRKSLLLGPKLIPISPGQIHKPAISVHKS